MIDPIKNLSLYCDFFYLSTAFIFWCVFFDLRDPIYILNLYFHFSCTQDGKERRDRIGSPLWLPGAQPRSRGSWWWELQVCFSSLITARRSPLLVEQDLGKYSRSSSKTAKSPKSLFNQLLKKILSLRMGIRRKLLKSLEISLETRNQPKSQLVGQETGQGTNQRTRRETSPLHSSLKKQFWTFSMTYLMSRLKRPRSQTSTKQQSLREILFST